MASPRQLGRRLFAKILARVLIAALLFSLVPPRGEASIPTSSLPDPRPLDLAPAASKTSCLVVVIVVRDPIWLTKSAFGEELAHTGSDPQPYRFAGEPYDPNAGFYYNRARWMDPRVGRFASMDGWHGTPWDPASLHRYLYANDSPADRIDPSGRESIGETTLAGALNNVVQTMASLSARAVEGAITWSGAMRLTAGLRWTAAVFRTLIPILGGGAAIEMAEQGEAGVDVLVIEAEEAGQIALELKGWNWDFIARFPGRAAGMMEQLAEQAPRYAQLYGERLVYAFKQVAQSPQGQALQAQAVAILQNANVKYITYGEEQLAQIVTQLIQ
jgi:RHS repeat-associated protein